VAKGTKKLDIIYRAVKFEIHPTLQEKKEITVVSESLRTLFNGALEERQHAYEYIAPVNSALKAAKSKQITSWETFIAWCEKERTRAEEYARTAPGKNDAYAHHCRRTKKKAIALQQEGVPFEVSALEEKRDEAYQKHGVSLYDQINALTARRAQDKAFEAIPRNWQEETLDKLNAAYTSFITLIGKGDPDARPPKKYPEGIFCEIPGRYGFKINGSIMIFTRRRKEWLRVFIPMHQCTILERAREECKNYPKNNFRYNKFTLFCTENASNGNQRFWVAIAYQMNCPEKQKVTRRNTVFVALGASSIGVSTEEGEQVIKLWRPDFRLKPEIDAVTARMKKCQKGSRIWKKRLRARRKTFQRLAYQQKQHHREVVQHLLKLGTHFVVNELVIRSKRGKLADSAKAKRGGSPHGLNWAAQNTGNIASLVAWLQIKVSEKGGSVRKVRLHLNHSNAPRKKGHDNKLDMVRLLREQYLATGTR
jgi:hypothetical protein